MAFGQFFFKILFLLGRKATGVNLVATTTKAGRAAMGIDNPDGIHIDNIQRFFIEPGSKVIINVVVGQVADVTGISNNFENRGKVIARLAI